MTSLSPELANHNSVDIPDPTDQSILLPNAHLQSPVGGAEIMLRAVTELDEFKSKYPHPNEVSHWDQDARHTRIWLESNQTEIQAALERMLANAEYSRADIEEQIRLLFESLDTVPIIRQAAESYTQRAEYPSTPVPERIALNRARHELLRVVAAGLQKPLNDSQGKAAPYIGHYDVEQVTSQLPLDPRRARISAEHAQLIHEAHEALMDNQTVRIYGSDTNRWFDAWVKNKYPLRDSPSGKEYVDLFGEWFTSPDYLITRRHIKEPVYAACDALGLPNILDVPATVRDKINQTVITELQADLRSDDLRYDFMHKPLEEADRTTTELTRQISALGFGDKVSDTIVRAKVYKANQTAIEIVAGLLYLQQSGKSSMSQIELASRLDAFARTGAFMYTVEVNPLPNHDKANDIEYATIFNEALRSFVLADAIAKTAVGSTESEPVEESIGL